MHWFFKQNFPSSLFSMALWPSLALLTFFSTLYSCNPHYNIKSDLFCFPHLLFSALLIALGGKMSLGKKITKACGVSEGKSNFLPLISKVLFLLESFLSTSWKTLDAKIILPWDLGREKEEEQIMKTLKLKTRTLYIALKY